MKQKLGLVAALQHDPDLLILDEPTTGLDPLVREALFEVMNETGRSGKTLFHSSHVLSEVDRTCTRVGIIRDGRLLAVREIEAMRRGAIRRMVVRFAGEAPIAELDLPGIEVIEHDGSQVVLRVAGPLDPLIRALARHRVAQLIFPESNLEEAFVELYRVEPEESS
jgi:ABC-2 type transport system ATP-binding protein